MDGLAYPKYAAPDPLQDFNPRAPSDFNPRAPSHFNPRDPSHFNPRETSYLFQASHQDTAEEVLVIPDSLKISMSDLNQSKGYTSYNGQTGEVDLELVERGSAARKSHESHQGKVASDVSISEADSTPTGLQPSSSTSGFGIGMAGLSESTCKGPFLPSADPRSNTEAHIFRRYFPMNERNNPYIDSLKTPAWQPAGGGLGPHYLQREEWAQGLLGRCPSFGALPSYHGYDTEMGAFQRPALQHTNEVRRNPDFMRDSFMSEAAGSSDCTRSVGLFREGYSTAEGTGLKSSLWPAFPMDEWGERLVGKSQSMRAFYSYNEENEALRRALYSMRRGAEEQQAETKVSGADAARKAFYSQDRYIGGDTGEARTMSMRERGRWGVDTGGGYPPMPMQVQHWCGSSCGSLPSTPLFNGGGYIGQPQQQQHVNFHGVEEEGWHQEIDAAAFFHGREDLWGRGESLAAGGAPPPPPPPTLQQHQQPQQQQQHQHQHQHQQQQQQQHQHQHQHHLHQQQLPSLDAQLAFLKASSQVSSQLIREAAAAAARGAGGGGGGGAGGGGGVALSLKEQMLLSRAGNVASIAPPTRWRNGDQLHQLQHHHHHLHSKLPGLGDRAEGQARQRNYHSSPRPAGCGKRRTLGGEESNQRGGGGATNQAQLGKGGARSEIDQEKNGKSKGGGSGEKVAAAAEEEARMREAAAECAMCGQKLWLLNGEKEAEEEEEEAEEAEEEATEKKKGLPLRLCPACHPRAAASLPATTTISTAAATKPPPSRHQTRRPAGAGAHNNGRASAAPPVTSAISMACKPTASAAKKKKTRIVDLCRHLLGLTMKPTPS